MSSQNLIGIILYIIIFTRVSLGIQLYIYKGHICIGSVETFQNLRLCQFSDHSLYSSYCCDRLCKHRSQASSNFMSFSDGNAW